MGVQPHKTTARFSYGSAMPRAGNRWRMYGHPTMSCLETGSEEIRARTTLDTMTLLSSWLGDTTRGTNSRLAVPCQPPEQYLNHGAARPLGTIVLADDPVAADAICAQLMGFEAGRIVHMRKGSRFMGNAHPALIDEVGEFIRPPTTLFQVVQEFECRVDPAHLAIWNDAPLPSLTPVVLR